MRDDLPFVCPVPVRPREMTSLHAEHTELAVETDLARMGGHGLEAIDPNDVLYADFQLSAFANSVSRQGSGRAGFYRGHYLKGIGRTPLAANWNDARDWYHASGHLFPTSAVREYLTTVYMEARGLGDRIVPCRGLLLGRLEPGLREALARAFGDAFEGLAPIDRELLAVTAKPAGFARASNFLWLAARLSGWGEEWRVFLPLMEASCAPDGKLAHAPEQCSAKSLVRAIASAARRALDGLARDFAAGVSWNSLWNNFTLDGRMLDLEVASLACRPFVGALAPFGFGTSSPTAEDARPRRLAGLEVVDHAVELRANAARLASEVQKLLDLGLEFEPGERAFMRELSTELRAFASDETLFGVEALASRAIAALPEYADPGALAREIAGYVAERRKAWAEPSLSHVVLARTPLELRRTEPTVSQSLWLPPDTFRPGDWDDASFMAAQFAAVEACTDVDRALAAVSEATSAIRARWA